MHSLRANERLSLYFEVSKVKESTISQSVKLPSAWGLTSWHSSRILVKIFSFSEKKISSFQSLASIYWKTRLCSTYTNMLYIASICELVKKIINIWKRKKIKIPWLFDSREANFLHKLRWHWNALNFLDQLFPQ